MKRFNLKLVFEKGIQRKFLNEIMTFQNLNQKGLAKILGISRRGLGHWLNEERLLPKIIFETLSEKFPLTKKYEKYILYELPKNWGQIKGGKIRSKTKLNLTTRDRIKGFGKANAVSSKRKEIGPKGELMFNTKEKLIALELLKYGFDYQYEPIISLGKNYAVPDFLVENNIIERCGYGDWKPYWSNLLKKIKRLEKYKRGNVIILVPSKNFNIAVKRLHKLKNITILKEENRELLLDLIRVQGPITTEVVGTAQHGRAASS